MRPLRYFINVTLDGCCDHRAIPADEDSHRHAIENFGQADALLFGRVTYEMMEAAWRAPARTGARPDWMQPWMEPFARTIEDHSSRLLSETPDHARIVCFWRVIKAARANESTGPTGRHPDPPHDSTSVTARAR